MVDTATNTKEGNNPTQAPKTPGVSENQPGTPREKNRRRRRPVKREDRVRSDLNQKIVSIRRVTRVIAGGRRFSFSVTMVAGDGKGKVGVGVGKSSDTALAIGKALAAAKKNMMTIPRTESGSIPHEVSAKYCASQISIMPAPNRGLVAGGSVRTILELAGVKDITAKINSRSKNQLNNARATLKALSMLKK